MNYNCFAIYQILLHEKVVKKKNSFALCNLPLEKSKDFHALGSSLFKYFELFESVLNNVLVILSEAVGKLVEAFSQLCTYI